MSEESVTIVTGVAPKSQQKPMNDLASVKNSIQLEVILF